MKKIIGLIILLIAIYLGILGFICIGNIFEFYTSLSEKWVYGVILIIIAIREWRKNV